MLINDLKGQSLDTIDMEGLLKRQNGNRYDNHYDEEIWQALHDVVEDIVRMSQ